MSHPFRLVEGCISCLQEKRNDQFQNMNSIMANLNLGQDVANKRERKWIAAHIVAKSYSLYRYFSLININPSAD